MDGEQIKLPIVPCRRCGGRRFWYRKSKNGQLGEWLCSWCHIPPDNNVVAVITLGPDIDMDREGIRRMVKVMNGRGD